MNPFREVNWRPSRPERRKFALSLLVGFPAMALVALGWQRWQGGAWTPGFPLALAGIGGAVGVVLWLVPQIAWPFYVIWYGVACAVGLVVGNVILALVYLVMFTVVGWIGRAVGRNALTKGFDRGASTYWHDAETPVDATRYYRQY